MFWKKKNRKVQVLFIKRPMTELGSIQDEIQGLLNGKKCELINMTTEIIVTPTNGPNLLFITMVYARDE